MIKEFISESSTQTQDYASVWVKSLNAGDIVLLSGDLGAGKTTFVKGLVKGLKIKGSAVHSPTFSLIHEYSGPLSLIHVDLYRLQNLEEFQELCLEEYWQRRAICVVEWAERFLDQWPASAYWVKIQKKDKNHRRISIQKKYESE